ncbi:MAG: HupE/UreJ family protein [Proteobacteria bacterium]|nr:HupE/UreJ family protein [Pseudomonadota bacterium]
MKKLFVMAAMTIATPALAHSGGDHIHSIGAGLAHPLSGADHIAAMVLVGIWAGLVGGARLWVWPATFVGAMILGGILGASGIAVPWVETAIAVSVLALGIAVAGVVRLPIGIGAVLIALFGAAHGFAHGQEASDTSFALYALGFVAATAALHALGVYGVRFMGTMVSRLLGAAGVVAGLAMVLA